MHVVYSASTVLRRIRRHCSLMTFHVGQWKRNTLENAQFFIDCKIVLLKIMNATLTYILHLRCYMGCTGSKKRIRCTLSNMLRYRIRVSRSIVLNPVRCRTEAVSHFMRSVYYKEKLCEFLLYFLTLIFHYLLKGRTQRLAFIRSATFETWFNVGRSNACSC